MPDKRTYKDRAIYLRQAVTLRQKNLEKWHGLIRVASVRFVAITNVKGH